MGVGWNRARLGRALERRAGRRRLRRAGAPRGDRGGRAARAGRDRAELLAGMDLVRRESAGGNRSRAPAVRDVRLPGASGESALREAAESAPGRKRRPRLRVLSRGRALDPRAAEAPLAAHGGMSEPFRRAKIEIAGPRNLAYVEWGEPGAKTLVCVHGLTRCARDFDFLAAEMARHGYRVICADFAGRGDSDWLADPMDYALPTYARDLLMLLARLHLESVHWLGTSLGGLVGMTIAAIPESPVERLVLNDVGPVLAAPALQRIAGYLGIWPPLPTIEEAEQYVRSTSATFGPHTDAEWRFLTEHVVRK